MGLKESGLRGSLRSVSTGVTAIPDSGLVQDFNAQDTGTVTVNGTVTQWDDQSGNDYHLTGDASDLVSDGINGNPSVLFDGVDDRLTATDEATSLPFELFAVVEMQTTPDGHQIFIDGETDRAVMADDNGDWEAFAGDSSFFAGSPDTDPHILHWIYESDSLTIREDDITLGSDETASNDLHDLSMGADLTGDRNAHILFGRLLRYNRLLDADERDRVHTGLSSEWGISI